MSKCETHLGVVLACSKQGQSAFINNRINTCKSICYGIQSLGSHSIPVSPIVATKLYNSLCLTKLCYGMELLDLDNECINAMESFHSNSAKMFQGLPIQSAGPDGIGNLGWQSVQSLIDLMRMLFMWKILSLRTTCIYKEFMLKRIIELLLNGNGSGPTWNILGTFEKYGMLRLLIESVEIGVYMPYSRFKIYIKNVVSVRDFKIWRINSILFKSLIHVTLAKSKHNVLGWITFLDKHPNKSKECKCVINLLLNTYRLGSKMCPLCTTISCDSIEHILFECNSGATLRNELWNPVVNSSPYAMIRDINMMSNYSKAAFILNAFNCIYVDDWKMLYMNMCNFIFTMYSDYYTKLMST